MLPERLRPLVQATADLSERFRSAGHTLYLVGGSVRDAIVANGASGTTDSDHDLDFTTDALPDEIEATLRDWADAVWTQGKRFGTIGARKGGQTYEITTHRAEVYRPDSRKPDVAFGDVVEDDLSRRDFTVNAMALRLPELELVDPFGGLADLSAHRLRTPLGPEVSFSDDPLRMLRAARFTAKLDLDPVPEVIEAVQTGHDRLSIVSSERIRDELDKIMVLPEPSKALWFVVRTGLAGEFLPELPGLALEQDPIHRHKDVLAHTLAVVDNTQPDRLLRLAALFHDVGKPKTRAYGEEGVTFHHHEVVGARMTRARMTALRYPNEDVDVVTELVNLHLRFHTYRLGWTDRAVRRYVRDAGTPSRPAERAHPLRLHHSQREQGEGARAADGRARGADRHPPRARGARRHPARPGRRPGDGAARDRPRSRGGEGARVLARAPARGGSPGRGRGAAATRRLVEGPGVSGRRPRGQASGQVGPGSPRAKDSTRTRASSSWYCTGGDFMK